MALKQFNQLAGMHSSCICHAGSLHCQYRNKPWFEAAFITPYICAEASMRKMASVALALCMYALKEVATFMHTAVEPGSESLT